MKTLNAFLIPIVALGLMTFVACDAGGGGSSSDDDAAAADAATGDTPGTPDDDVATPDPDGVTPEDEGQVEPDEGPACTDECNMGGAGCNGNVTWSCQDVEGCLAKVQGDDCSDVGQVCTGAGTCEDPGGPVNDKIICPEFLGCLIEECQAVLNDEAQLQACVQQAFTAVCAPKAETMNETNLFLDWNNCLANNCADAADNKAAVNCQRENCLAETAECYSGSVYGIGPCNEIEGCLGADCAQPLQAPCMRTCLNDATKPAVESFFDMDLCVQAQCVDSPDPQACAQQVLATPTCSLEFTQCAGDGG